MPRPGPILANGTFSSGTSPWWSSPNVTIAAQHESLLAAVAAGTTNRWDAMVAHDFSPLRGGGFYTLSFDASAAIPRNIVVTVQMGQSPYSNTRWQNPEIETFTEHHSYPFTSNIDDNWGLVTFQLGDNGPFTFCLDNVPLVLNGTDWIMAIWSRAAQRDEAPGARGRGRPGPRFGRWDHR